MITTINEFRKIFENYSSEDIIDHITNISDRSDVPDYYFELLRKAQPQFVRKELNIQDILQMDPKVAEYVNNGEDRYEDDENYPDYEELYYPIVVWNNQVIDGYNRLMMLYKSGEKTVSAYVSTNSTNESYYHGTPDSLIGTGGIHVGTLKAATQALEARIGVPAEGTWDGTREYGKTLLAGQKRLKELEKERGYFLVTGYNCGALEDNYYPTQRETRATYSDRTPIPFTAKPKIYKVDIVGKMTNWEGKPHGDQKANLMMIRQLRKGNARSGYYYINDGEDSGSISAVVPDASFLKIYETKDNIDNEDRLEWEMLPNFLYHVSPIENKDSILKKGIILKEGGTSHLYRTYTPRIYLACSLISAYDIQLNFNSHNSKTYLIYKIDKNKLDHTANIYEDSKFAHGVHIDKNIPKQAIVEVINPDNLHFNEEDLDNLYTTTWFDSDFE
jgi:hypothetical protein